MLSYFRFDKLVHLNLDENRISKLNMRSFTEMKSLQFLSLDGNYLEDIPDEAFQNLHHVRRLNLAYNKLKKLTDSKGFDFLPCYDFMVREKNRILPKSLIEAEMELSDKVAKMPLNTMLARTLTHLYEVDRIKSKIDDLVVQVGASSANPLPLRFLYKIGMDGTGGMSQYHQNCTDGSFIEDNKLFGN